MGLHRKRNWKRKFSEMERVALYLYAQGRCRKRKIELEKSCHGDLLSHIFYVTRVIGIEPTSSDCKSRCSSN